MPLENLDEEGLPRNPDVRLAQLKFLLATEDLSIDKDAVKAELMTAIVENGNTMRLHSQQHTPTFFQIFHHVDMAPFYITLCSDVQQTVDKQLYDRLRAENVHKLEQLDAAIDDAEKNFGEIESRDTLMKKAEYLCQIGDKVFANSLVLR